MPGAALAATAVVGSSLIGASATRKAAKTQAAAANYAADLQDKQYQQTREDMAPWRNYGAGAMGLLAQLYGVPYGLGGQGQPSSANGNAAPNALYTGTIADPNARQKWLESTPGYQTALTGGMNALTRYNAASGSLLSGGGIKSAMRFGSELASNTYNNELNRIASMAGIGQSSAYQTGALGAQAAQAQGNALMAGANARASGYAANGQLWGNALGGAAGALGAAIPGNYGMFMGGYRAQPVPAAQSYGDAWGFQTAPSGNVNFLNSPASIPRF